jgi:serine/threonine-protein kinase
MTSRADRERVVVEIAALSRRLDELRGELEALDREVDATIVDAPCARAESSDAPSRLVATPPSDAGATRAEGRATSARPPAGGDERRSLDEPFERRFERKELLGEGGMGEVWLCTDRRIGREVAVKMLRPIAAAIPKLRDRFLFEARVQGQLEHPGIVPVYDLGARADGSDYFVMKRLGGKTLHQVLKALRAGDAEALAAFTRRKLLAAFQSVCLAAEFAHRHGVVHRDLKPANVMLGAYGEVSVLDWGVARRPRGDAPATPAPGLGSLDDAYTDTGVGEVLGTPGYMAPEQAMGDADITPRADVFALGAILFEILTLERLVPGESDTEVRLATLRGEYEGRISKRFPALDVPAELAEICARATALDPDARLPSARAVHDAIERYLEGESDVQRRRSLSKEHTRLAIQALAEARATGDAAAARDARRRSIEEVTRALALDAQNATALRTMMAIATDVPAATTPEAEAAVRAIEDDSARKTARRAAEVYLIVISNIAAAALLGVESWTVLALSSAFLLAAAVVARFVSSAAPPDQRWGLLIVALSSCGFALTTGLFGPFVYAPTLVAANVITASIGVEPRIRRLTIACGVAAVLLPVAAQLFGWVPPSWIFRDGIIAIVPRAVRLDELRTTIFLAAVSVGSVILPALVVGSERDARVRAERRLALQAHQLAEFLPAEAKRAAASAR